MRLQLFIPGIREGDQPELELTQIQVGLQILLECAGGEIPRNYCPGAGWRPAHSDRGGRRHRWVHREDRRWSLPKTPYSLILLTFPSAPR
jgi:hypothetical protein